MAAGRRGLMQSPAEGGIRHLVVVLEIRDERVRRQVERGRTAALPLPGVPLALVQVAEPRARDQLLRTALVVAVVRFTASGERDHRRVMRIVVPERVKA